MLLVLQLLLWLLLCMSHLLLLYIQFGQWIDTLLSIDTPKLTSAVWPRLVGCQDLHDAVLVVLHQACAAFLPHGCVAPMRPSPLGEQWPRPQAALHVQPFI
jgi:hypothetical protein